MKFTELNAEQQARAIAEHRDINVDFQEWNDCVKEEHHHKLESVGFDDVESAYSGFSHQGDGASFTASSLDIEKFLRSKKRWTYYQVLHEMIRVNDLWVKVVRTTYQYCHENTTQAELYGEHHIELTPIQEKLYEELENEIDAYITKAGQEYYKALYTSYYDLISDEQVKETIIANDMEFEVQDKSVTYI